MPRKKDIKKVLVIGSGPIVIGQAAEFDYAGTQACRALKAEGLEVVLINSNPATIMTDNAMADQIYIEPLTIDTVKRIIEKEKPDSLLSTLGGQTGLTLSMQLAKEGFLEEHGVALLGARPETIDKAEDRQSFKDTMEEIGEPCIPSLVVNTVEDAVSFAEEIGYPVIVRPAFTLGGSGGGIAESLEELTEITTAGLRLSPITQVLIEKSVAGWKEIEFEVVRDSADNAIVVCPMENFDPVGVHTGDSIVVAPTVSLSEKELTMLREASLNIVRALAIEGGCNCQFALHPSGERYAVIEVNPRVSRSSALASKATGYPIAKVAAKIAIGYTLDELISPEVEGDPAKFEPKVDYYVVKFPRWPFDKFVYASRKLGTQMKATGEVMAIGDSFEHALLKAVRGAEISLDSLRLPTLSTLSTEEIREKLYEISDLRLFVVYEAIARGISLDDIYEITKIDHWFLQRLVNIFEMEQQISQGNLTKETYLAAKKMGYPDTVIERLSGETITNPVSANFKIVSPSATAFQARSPYFYSTYSREDEAKQYLASHRKESKGTIVVFGSGPIRIGQGIEFDYASVHCVWALQRLGYEVVIVNNNPETVSTDYDTADRLYFEPLYPEDVKHILEVEKPLGVVVAFGGQTAIKLIHFLEQQQVPIIGTTADAIDMAEDRERFDALLESVGISRPEGYTIMTEEAALKAAHTLGYPVLMRPSYVLGGQNMVIAFSDQDITEYMEIILRGGLENPVLIDKYLRGMEVEVDAICDGEDILIPGIMEHIERAGVHSGDSIAVYPATNIPGNLTRELIEHTKSLALSLNTKGLVNIQYVIYNNEIYVIEVNPRASRTIPYISKVTGVPMVELATRAMLGEKLKDMGYGTGLYPKPLYMAVKAPVFSFEKLPQLDIHLGPEMKSTGEVLGIGRTLDEALYKGILAAGSEMKKDGGVFITVRDSDKPDIVGVAEKFAELGFALYATEGTAQVLEQAGLSVSRVEKIYKGGEDGNNGLTLLKSGKISYVISTSSKGRNPARDSVKIRRAAIERAIPCLTSVDTAAAIARVLRGRYSEYSTELVDINHMRTQPISLDFTKMEVSGNGHLHFDITKQTVPAPESMSITLSNPHYSIGADGIVLIGTSETADASMRLYNKDGSEGKVGGNALHCVAKYLYERDIVKKEELAIETLWGTRNIELYVQNHIVESSKVDLGLPNFAPESLPTTLPAGRNTEVPLQVGGKTYDVTYFSIGNPYCVVFCDYPEHMELEKIGPLFEYHKAFPNRVNTVFVTVEHQNSVRMRIWERGNEETYSSGTGACAAVVAAILAGKCQKDSDITVKQKGGELMVRYTDAGVFLTARANEIFSGTVTV